MPGHPSVIIAAYDSRLRDEIEIGLMPHFGHDCDCGLESLTEHVPRMYADPFWDGPEGAQERWRDKIRRSVLPVVAFTGFHVPESEAILSVLRERRSCGLILKTEEVQRVAMLSVIHHRAPFRFVVYHGSIRAKTLGKLFPGAQYLCDITSLVEPGKQVVEFISKKAREILAEAQAT